MGMGLKGEGGRFGEEFIDEWQQWKMAHDMGWVLPELCG